MRQCAERFEITPHIRYGAEVLGAAWDEAEQVWRITTASDQIVADVLALGNGPLSEPSIPNFPGLERFEGTFVHSAR
jgi:cation diffusion facilitator CzcD-associated flavoprotein CzcO